MPVVDMFLHKRKNMPVVDMFLISRKNMSVGGMLSTAVGTIASLAIVYLAVASLVIAHLAIAHPAIDPPATAALATLVFLFGRQHLRGAPNAASVPRGRRSHSAPH